MNHLRSVKVWLYGLMSSVISGACQSVAVMFVDPKDFNFAEGRQKLLMVFGAAALFALINYLAKHPLPAWDPERDGERREARRAQTGPGVGV